MEKLNQKFNKNRLTQVKAGIASGGGPDEAHMFAGIAPRLFMRLHGLYDQGWKKVQETEANHDLAKGFYREKGSADNLVLRTLPCGRHFHDEFKWEAYARLKKTFWRYCPQGMSSVKR